MTLLALAIVASAFVSIDTQPAVAQSPIVGCYDLKLGVWLPQMELGADSVYASTPGRIRLDSAESLAWRGSLVLVAAPGAMPSVHSRMAWRLLGDTAQLIFSNGYSGVRMMLSQDGSTLRGMAHTYWDFGRPTQSADVEAVPVACDAALADSVRFRHRFPRGVGFQAADSIRIGEPLPIEKLELLRESANTYRVATRALHPFDRSAEMRVSTDAAGVVRQIRIAFAADRKYEDVVRDLSEVYGSPTSVTTSETSGRSTRSTSWASSVLRISVTGSSAPQFPVSLFMYNPSAPR